MDWYPDESTTSPPACAGVGLLGVVSVVEEDLGRLVCCCGSWVLRRCSAWGLPLRRGSRSPLPDPELDPLLRRLWRLVPRFIVPAAAEHCPAAGGTTGAERQSESWQRGPKMSLELEGGVPLVDITEEDEDEEEEGALEWEKRLRCWWKSCFSSCPKTFMFSLQLWFILPKEGCDLGLKPRLFLALLQDMNLMLSAVRSFHWDPDTLINCRGKVSHYNLWNFIFLHAEGQISKITEGWKRKEQKSRQQFRDDGTVRWRTQQRSEGWILSGSVHLPSRKTAILV